MQQPGRVAVAHVRQDVEGRWYVHRLEDHLSSTARTAAEFARAFGNQDWGQAAGLWHDLGKYKPAFQDYIRADSGYAPNEVGSSGASSDHSHATAGAIHASALKKGAGRVLAYLIAGHHGGLPDWNSEAHKGLALRLQEEVHLRDALAGTPPTPVLKQPAPTTQPCGHQMSRPDAAHLWVRMLFSCLVDADFLDTESFMAPAHTDVREAEQPGISELQRRFDLFMEDKQKHAPDTPVNRLRRRVLEECREAASLQPGLFSLTVPTGGGKTLSSVAFALAHAIRHGKRRIIVAIPYTSIIEQTAEELRCVFGDYAVLEHHSNFDPERQSEDRKFAVELAAENWDAPIVVTTNVQLFESLFAARTSSCRKLHNIVNSVVILDEVQMLPPEHLKPILSVLQALGEDFGVSMVLCTATQPVLTGAIGAEPSRMQGLGDVRELVRDPASLAHELRRVQVRIRGTAQEPASWEDIAAELAGHEQVLCVVNARRDCRQLHALLPPGAIHLSALMCPEHRSKVIADIKRRLYDRAPVRVVSTQLVEAGVDLDFPVVYRALAGLDSVAQAAGRCNREGRMNEQGKLGEVVVFVPPKAAPPGLLRKGQEAGAEMLRCYQELAERLTPESFDLYFRLFYGRVNSFDVKDVTGLLAGADASQFQFQFRTAADRFKLIDDAGQKPVIVWHQSDRHDSRQLLEELRAFGVSRTRMRRLQRFGVNVPERVFVDLKQQGAIEEIDGVWAQSVPGLYDDVFGLRLEGPNWSGDEFIC